MAGCQAETFQCAPSVRISKLVCRCVVANKIETTSFLISCVKCLWDIVGSFLGRRFKSSKPLPAGRYSFAYLVKPRGRYERFK